MYRIIALLIVVVPLFTQGQAYEYKFKIVGPKDTVVYLANYYGAKQYYKDTVPIDKNGMATFKGDKPLACGIYSVVMPNKKKYFEFIVNEPKFYMETDTNDLVMNMKVKGSQENGPFYEYLQYINNHQKEAGELNAAMKKEDITQADKAKAKTRMEQINKEVTTYKEQFMKDHPDLLITRVFLASKDPQVPETPTLPNGQKDSLFPYRYYKAHYFDHIDLTDECLLRSPVFHNKLKYYMTKLTPQIPDSINKAADHLVEQARENREMFKYIVHWVTNNYEQSKIMGMDAVFVHMADNYYLTGQAWWMDSTQMSKVKERANTLRPILIGKQCPDVILQDTMGTWKALSKIQASYTVLFIWDPDCGHCKKEIPKIRKAYKEKLKDMGVKVLAVSTDFENKKWKEFLRENDMPFINVSDSPQFPSNFRDVFDVYATPVVLVLDEKKKIIAKKLSADQIEEFIERMDRDKKRKEKQGEGASQ